MATIRRATISDAAAIAAHLCAVLRVDRHFIRGGRRRRLTRWRGASRRLARPGRGLCSKTMVASSDMRMPRPHHERAAYRWSVSTAIYISRSHHRRGAGRALYTTLFALLRALGYRQATAGITLPNPASVGLHAAFGFVPVGVYRHIGYKMGGWHDVGWYQAEIQPASAQPTDPLPVRELVETATWEDAVQRGLKLYSHGQRKRKSEQRIEA